MPKLPMKCAGRDSNSDSSRKGILSPRQWYGKSTTYGALSLRERRRAEVSGSQRKDFGYQFGYQWLMREVAA